MWVSLSVLLSISSGWAGEWRTAPLNPEYIEYVQDVEAKSGAMNTLPEWNSTGCTPFPVDLSHVDGRDVLSTAKRALIFPRSYDLRSLGYITPVRDQNPYGTCWSFGAMGSWESNMRKTTGTVCDLSEWHLAYFAYVDEEADLPAFTARSPQFGADPIFDQGGNILKSTAILARWTGAVAEKDRPYQNDTGWPESARPLASDPPSFRLEDSLFLGSNFDSDTVKAAIMDYGAVTFRVVWDSSSYNRLTYSYYNPNMTGGGHALVIVGWDDDYPASSFTHDPGTNGAWIVKNSWGTDW